ncbi:hypothetical protein, partial [Micromonospora harpali]
RRSFRPARWACQWPCCWPWTSRGRSNAPPPAPDAGGQPAAPAPDLGALLRPLLVHGQQQGH